VSYADSTIRVLNRAVMTREADTDELPMLAVLLGTTEAIVVSSDGRHQTPAAFLDDVWVGCRNMIDPVAVGMVAEFFMRPIRPDDRQSFQPGSLREASVYDPEVVTGWGGIAAAKDRKDTVPLLWSLHIEDDGTRTVTREDSDAVLLSRGMSERILLLLNTEPESTAHLSREDRRILFEYVKDSLPAIGLTAERIQRTRL